MPSEHRLHPLSILFGFGGLLRDLAVPALLVLITAGPAGLDWQMWAMVLVVPFALLHVGRYVSFRYRYDANEMVIRSGVFFRKERHIPYARIQNLDSTQNVVHRLTGVVQVRVDTGGGQEPEATMSVLSVGAADEMRRRVFEQRNEVGALADLPSPPPGRILLGLPPRELILLGLIQNRGVVVIAAAFGLLWELGLLDRLAEAAFGEQVSGRGVVRDAVGALLGDGGVPANRIVLAVAALAGLLLFVRLISMGWTLVRLHGFKLTRDGNDLRTEHGLLTRLVATIPVRRIQTLTIQEGPLHRLFGRVSVRVETARADAGQGGAGSGNATQREWLAPIIRRAELLNLLREIIPELDLSAVGWRTTHPRAFGRALKGSLLVPVAVAIPLVILLEWWALAPVALLAGWAFVYARYSVARLGWAVTDGAVLFRSGWVTSQVTVARFTKIQAVTLLESPFDRRTAMARVRVDTAGGGAESHRVDIPYLSRDAARELYRLLATEVDRTALQW